jgi:hypothetical protein
MPRKKNKISKQNQVDVVPKSVKVESSDISLEEFCRVALSASIVCSSLVGLMLFKLVNDKCSEKDCDLISVRRPLIAGIFTVAHSPAVGGLVAGVSELSVFAKKKIVEKYKDFKNLPVEQQVVLGLAACNILVGTAVGRSFFVTPNAVAREYLFDAALHFLNAYALNSESKLIHAIALVGNSVRLLQILGTETSTIPIEINLIDSLNHSYSIFGFGGKLLSKSVSPAKPIEVQQASTHRNTM